MSDKADRIYVKEVRKLAEAGVPFTSEFLRGIGEPIGKGLWDAGMDPWAFNAISCLWAENAMMHALDEGWIEQVEGKPYVFIGKLTKEEDPPGPPRARPPGP